MKTVQLNNGVEVPVLGFGTYQITNPNEAEKAVTEAIQTLNEGESQFFSHADPEMIKWMAGRRMVQ